MLDLFESMRINGETVANQQRNLPNAVNTKISLNIESTRKTL